MDDTPRPAKQPKPSMAPSWVLLGFAVGVVFMWALPREPETIVAEAPTTVVKLERPTATDIEAVFEEWGRYAAWENDRTQVALWDVDRRSYSIYYEILRTPEGFYFRSIPHLTRPLLTHGVPESSPLAYTESEKMRQEWLKRNDPVDPALLPPVNDIPRPSTTLTRPGSR